MTNFKNKVKPEPLKCPFCQSCSTRLYGQYQSKDGLKQKYHCSACGKTFCGALICPNCYAFTIKRRGFYRSKKGLREKRQCKNCGKNFYGAFIKE